MTGVQTCALPICALSRILGRALLWAAAAVGVWVLAYRWVDPPTTWLIEAERARLGEVAREGAALEALPPLVRLAFPAAEDARFCGHWGIDLVALREAVEAARAGGRLRGASTLTQQVAKNAFLWPGRSWLRKALEAPLALLIEALWPKRRVLEVYLSVAEMGEGVFGLGAAARRWYGVEAAALTPERAARIAAILPSPRTRAPGAQGARAAAILEGATTLRADGRGACVL